MSRRTKLMGINYQRCPDCSTQMQTCGTLTYCPQCKRTHNIIDNTIKETNYNFNAKKYEGKQATNLKIQTHAKDIFNKINMRPSQSEINAIVEKVRLLHLSRGPNCKGYKQQTAAIIYIEFQDQIRMNFHQFCQKNKIQRKKFNKMYIIYQSILKQNTQTSSNNKELKIQEQLYEEESVGLKKEENPQMGFNENELRFTNQCSVYYSKEEEDEEDHKFDYLNDNAHQQNEDTNEFKLQQERQTFRKTIEELYDKIFPSFYLTKFKAQIIASIVNKSLIISQLYLQSRPANCLKKYFRIPSVIYCVLKEYKYKITMKKYITAVQKILNVKITQRMIGKFSTLCKTNLIKNGYEDGLDQSRSSNRNQSQTDALNEAQIEGQQNFY